VRRGEQSERDGGGEPTGTGITWERRRTRLVLPTLLVTAALAASVLGFVSPIRQLLAQEERIRSAKARVSDLDDENDKLQERIGQLQRDAVVEQIAREELGLVRPGEEAYVLVPKPPPPAPTTPAAPGATGESVPTTAAPAPTPAAPLPPQSAPPAPSENDGYHGMGTPLPPG
jgi:cell division protein FtsB